MEIKVTGLKEVEAQLVNLGSKNGTRIVRRALLIAADPIIEQAKHNVAKHSGALQLSIGRRFAVGSKNQSASILPEMGSRFSVVVAPFKGNRVATALHNLVYGRKRKGIFYGHLIEFGHRDATSATGRLRRSVRAIARAAARGDFTRLSAGAVPAQPFLAPALRDRARDAVNIFRAEVRDGINKELKRLSKK